MYISFDKGGISDFSNRYSKANNKYMKSYNPNQQSKHIIYLEANNLYRYAMPKLDLIQSNKWIQMDRS